MRISICLGNYARIPYCVPGPGINVYCVEELCYCLKENAFLLDLSLMDDGLLQWLDRECGLKELAKLLYPLVHRQGSLSAFVGTIFDYTGFFDRRTIGEVEQVLKRGAGLSGIEKKKSQVDYMVSNRKYREAIRQYDLLIAKWKENETEGAPLPAVSCLAAIWHNRGVALSRLMLYENAAQSFFKAWETEQQDIYYRDYLAAKRMELSEKEYVAFAADNHEKYELTLSLEKDIERLTEEWEQQPEYLRLNHRRELREGSDKQKYYEESDQLIQVLKSSYRSSMSI
ncbi:MAG: hypothetical protein ACI4HQ_03060 [Acetatifactor sp.]